MNVRARRSAPCGLSLLILLVACTGSSSVVPPPRPPEEITVAAFSFTESEILAELYSQALEAKGYPAEPMLNAGPRELVQPALAEGLIDVVPEYAGSALSFLTLGAVEGSASVSETHDALTRVVAPSGLVALTPAPAQDANAIVVSQSTADLYDLRDVSDLTSIGSQLVFGGPPECAHRRLCLVGLESAYGLRFREFIPLDSGGPLTLQALLSEGIDVALLFTTDPAIVSEGLVVLTDDRGLQPAENVTPLLRRQVVSAHGYGVVETLDAVSALLTTSDLREMIGQVVGGRTARDVAAIWLRDRRSALMERP
jgi:osmoprotectant transport system substrate-binding protein